MILAVDVSAQMHADFYINKHGAADVCLKRIRQVIHEYKISRTMLAFDHPKLFRKELYPPYKSNRPAHDPDYDDQLRVCYREGQQKYPVYCVEGFEADDVIASICHVAREPVMMYSSDSDLFQLLDQGQVGMLKSYRYKDGERSPELMTYDRLIQEEGLTPDRWIDYLILKGKAGQWPGAKGVGEKTAKELLKRWDAEYVLSHLAKLPTRLVNAKQLKGLHAIAPQFKVARQLVTLRKDVPL